MEIDEGPVSTCSPPFPKFVTDTAPPPDRPSPIRLKADVRTLPIVIVELLVFTTTAPPFPALVTERVPVAGPDTFILAEGIAVCISEILTVPPAVRSTIPPLAVLETETEFALDVLMFKEYAKPEVTIFPVVMAPLLIRFTAPP
jgi:hypothetical protein